VKSRFVLVVLLAVIGCTAPPPAAPAPTTIPTPTTQVVSPAPVTPTPTGSPAAASTPTSTPVPLATPTATATPTPTLSPTPSPTSTPAATATPTATAVPSPTPTPIALAPLSLRIIEPQSDIVVTSPGLTVRGITRLDTIVSINGLVVDVDVDGEFRATLVLNAGPNVIEVVASDLEGKQESKVLSVVYLPQK